MTLGQLQHQLHTIARLVDRLDIERLARSMAESAWRVRHDLTPRIVPPRITFAIAFARNLSADEWAHACAIYTNTLRTLRAELH